MMLLLSPLCGDPGTELFFFRDATEGFPGRDAGRFWYPLLGFPGYVLAGATPILPTMPCFHESLLCKDHDEERQDFGQRDQHKQMYRDIGCSFLHPNIQTWPSNSRGSAQRMEVSVQIVKNFKTAVVEC